MKESVWEYVSGRTTNGRKPLIQFLIYLIDKKQEQTLYLNCINVMKKHGNKDKK